MKFKIVAPDYNRIQSTEGIPMEGDGDGANQPATSNMGHETSNLKT